MKRVAEAHIEPHPQSYVIHNPVDGTRFFPSPHPKSPPRGISLRSLKGLYGLDLAINAYTRFEETNLTIVGQGPLKERLYHLIQTQNASVVLDPTPYPHREVPKLYNKHHYFVAPSRTESQGVAMCEAMACGLPVIGTRVGGIPEFVTEGEDGYLVPPNDPMALRSAVERLISDPSKMEKMGEKARFNILQKCGSETIITEELRLMRAIIGL